MKKDPAQHEENMLRSQPKRKPMGRVFVRGILQLDSSRVHKIGHFCGREGSASPDGSDHQCMVIVALLASMPCAKRSHR